MSDKPLQDAEARKRIIEERSRNVCVVAGAGTGKTTTIIARLVGMLAPLDDTEEPVQIHRVAAITFTRKAAGELRFRLREELLANLGLSGLSRVRGRRLRMALDGLDAAFVGTIHAFADRLLRRRPTEARLSPAYRLVEDTQPLVAEVMRRLLRAVERDELKEELGPWGAAIPASRLAEAAETLQAAQKAGIPLERKRTSWRELPSLEALLQKFIDSRDVVPVDPEPPEVDLRALEQVGEDIQETLKRFPGSGDTPGRRWLRQIARRLEMVHEDPSLAVGVVQDIFSKKLDRKEHFHDENIAWRFYNRLRWSSEDWNLRIVGPHRWLGARLVRLSPVAVALYEKVRAEHQVVDFVEVLLRLRDLLRDRPDVREEFQGLFEHIFVDEFQDTDPLQCEIIFFLAEKGATATRWDEVELAPSRLTVVGDPQQSIYRFRRADVGMYASAVRRMSKSGALCERLVTNFRSCGEIVAWYNQALPQLLGKGTAGAWIKEGRVRYQELLPSPALEQLSLPQSCVIQLEYTGENRRPVDYMGGHEIEAEALCFLIQNLLRPNSRTRVRDEDTGELRAVRPGDIAVLTETTSAIPLLIKALEGAGLRTTMRGGRLLMDHQVIRSLLLGYCALCDAQDGVAEASLLREPFFDLEDEEARKRSGSSWKHAQGVVRDLRKLRLYRSPGALMRDLIERTRLMQVLVQEPNGMQVLSACYDVALELERRAAALHLDAVAAARLARSWAAVPVSMTSPEPTGSDAVRALTVYQAKGLEFPIVILWDGFRSLNSSMDADWQVTRDGQKWAMRLGDVVFEHPASCGLLKEERRQRSHERERLAYVAATRARDLLVFPVPLRANPRRERNRVLARAVSGTTRVTYTRGMVPPWHKAPPPPEIPEPVGDPDLDAVQSDQLLQMTDKLKSAQTAPVTVQPLEEAAQEMAKRSMPESAWGSVPQEEDVGVDSFDEAVHAVLRLVLGEAQLALPVAVSRIVGARQLNRRRIELMENAQRALAALQKKGLMGGDVWLRAHVPVVLAQEEHNRLLKGVVDLLARLDGDLWIVEFKSGEAPVVEADLLVTRPEAVTEVRLYAKALEASGMVGDEKVRRAVLFTRNGMFLEV